MSIEHHQRVVCADGRAFNILQHRAHIDSMLKAEHFMDQPAEMAEYAFNRYDWDVRLPSPAKGWTRLEPVQPNGIMLLSHTDRDMFTLIRVSERLGRPLQLAGAFSAGYVHLDNSELDHAGVHILAGANGRCA